MRELWNNIPGTRKRAIITLNALRCYAGLEYPGQRKEQKLEKRSHHVFKEEEGQKNVLKGKERVIVTHTHLYFSVSSVNKNN